MTKEEAIKLVRSDKEIGVGSCSVFDECYTDEELWKTIQEQDNFNNDPNDSEALLKELRSLNAEQFFRIMGTFWHD